jgi:hypothetical protein
MSVDFSELPGWSFDADEVSAGVFKAVGRDRSGRTVETTGFDPEILIERCKQAALEMMLRESERLSRVATRKPRADD